MWGGTGLSWDWKPPSSVFSCQLVGPGGVCRAGIPGRAVSANESGIDLKSLLSSEIQKACSVAADYMPWKCIHGKYGNYPGSTVFRSSTLIVYQRAQVEPSKSQPSSAPLKDHIWPESLCHNTRESNDLWLFTDTRILPIDIAWTHSPHQRSWASGSPIPRRAELPGYDKR